MAQQEARNPLLEKLVDLGSWETRENLFPQWQDSFLYFCTRIFLDGVFRVSLRTLYLVRTHAACLMVHCNIGESGFSSKDAILTWMTAKYVRARPRTVKRPSLLRHCSDRSVSVTLVLGFDSLDLDSQDDIAWRICAHRSARTPSHASIWLFQQPRSTRQYSWSPAPLSHIWLQTRCPFPRGNMQSVEGFRPPCSRSRTEVLAALRQMWTVPDVEKSRSLDSTHTSKQG